jgi:primosomal protein N' (replication factor Y) (superfamily II helicase)
LRVRPAAAAPPVVRALPIRGAILDHGLSQPLIAAIDNRLARREQSLVYINRRGYAPVLHCHACGWMAECRRCAARLTLHLRIQRLRCHYCGHEERVAAACPVCGNQDLHGLGQGTQRVEEALVARFPQARVLRVDRDSTRRKGSFAAMRERIHAHEVDVLVGTQMLAKGHDFPRLTLVGVVGADHGLYSSEFRAAERLFQQLMQVAGRAGRADLPGEVLVQTEFPDHPLYQALVAQDFERFGRDLLAERQRAGFPPYVFQALLRVEGLAQLDVDAFLELAAASAERHAQEVEVYDPVPAAVPRIAGRFRAQLLVQADTRPALRRFVGEWHPSLMEQKAPRVRWVLDIDPIDL